MDRNGYNASILEQSGDQCYFCKTSIDLVRHEIYQGVGRRRSSKFYGLWVHLCPRCHQELHANPSGQRARELDIIAEQTALKHYGWSIKDFIWIFGKNYI